MKMSAMNSGEIHFLDFVFNPGSRTLQQNDTVFQLRKKQSDVLFLLCEKYPEPVSQADFLSEVWGGGYVTSQSIAQIIRSLRLSLGDETKSIIVTIPKLGYQLSAQPSRGEPGPVFAENRFALSPPENVEVENFSFSTRAIINMNPVSATEMSAIPYPSLEAARPEKALVLKTMFFSAAASVFFSSLIAIGYIYFRLIVR